MPDGDFCKYGEVRRPDFLVILKGERHERAHWWRLNYYGAKRTIVMGTHNDFDGTPQYYQTIIARPKPN